MFSLTRTNRYLCLSGTAASLMTLTASPALGSVIVTGNANAYTDASVIDLTAEGTLGWLTWDANGNPSSNQVQKLNPITSISFSEVGGTISNNANGGWRSGNVAHIDRSWTDGDGPLAASAADVGPWLNKYDAAANGISLQFDIDISSLLAGTAYEVEFFFSQTSFDTDLTAEQLDGTDTVISGESGSGSVDPNGYSSISITGNVAVGAETLRLSVSPDGSSAANWNWRMSSLTVSSTPIPEPASLALLTLGGLCMLGGRRRREV